MPNFTELITKYLEFRKIKGLRKDTLILDKRSLKQFGSYLAANQLTISSITHQNFLNYQAYLQNQGLKKTTYLKYLSIIKTFYNYLIKQEYLLKNPLADWQAKCGPKEITVPIPTPKEIELLLAVPRLQEYQGLRDRALLELTYSAGLRISELTNLNQQDLDLTNRLAIIRQSKGGNSRIVPFGKTAAHYLKLYLQKIPQDKQQAPLFQTQNGKKLQKISISRRFENYRKQLGFNFTFHSLRHACALHLLENQAGIRQIQALLGHSCLSTTQKYTRVLPLDLKKAHAISHPREKEALY